MPLPNSQFAADDRNLTRRGPSRSTSTVASPVDGLVDDLLSGRHKLGVAVVTGVVMLGKGA